MEDFVTAKILERQAVQRFILTGTPEAYDAMMAAVVPARELVNDDIANTLTIGQLSPRARLEHEGVAVKARIMLFVIVFAAIHVVIFIGLITGIIYAIAGLV